MPLYSDFTLAKYEDGELVIQITPPVDIGGMGLRLTVTKRFGQQSPILLKEAASGYGNGVSGITVLNSGDGRLKARFVPSDTSGLQPGNFACQLERTDSGSRTVLWQGFMILTPNNRLT